MHSLNSHKWHTITYLNDYYVSLFWYDYQCVCSSQAASAGSVLNHKGVESLLVQSGGSACCGWRIKERPWYVCLCVNSIDLTDTLKKRPIKWQRDLILSLFSSTKQCAWIPVREEAVWQHRERACDCARSTGTAKRRANYHFALHGYQTEWPQKCLPA